MMAAIKSTGRAAAITAGLHLGACLLLSQTSTPSGSISGTVQDNTGTALSRAIISVSGRPAKPGATFTPLNTAVLTAANGSYTVTAVPDGTYAICPHLPNSTLLPTCAWQSEPTVVISGGKAVIAATIRLQPGADLYIRVNDPNGTAAATQGKVAGAALMLAVRAPNGRLIPIPRTDADATGFNHHLSVPTGTALPFVAYSGYYSMTNAAGAPISSITGLGLTVNIPAGQGQQQEIITIH